MAEFFQTAIDSASDEVQAFWASLWKLAPPPRFWFGQRVRSGTYRGVVIGLQFRSPQRPLLTMVGSKSGWLYTVMLVELPHNLSVFEDDLEIDL